jgi:hypothetical protein
MNGAGSGESLSRNFLSFPRRARCPPAVRRRTSDSRIACLARKVNSMAWLDTAELARWL